ncbi:MAG: spermidine synthase [Candidatus Abyssobacteria bacterium SURF_17]|uniref:Spermidine synthase n=1 Tax=Candidatus Abyssobacteria bacterium SURF_17 TaxID=2093361 RepID=A0A419F022_9BACT|nr:MAG: spermidine synthase [Candidatus Abyssubacteria bacterium SURF_17]
MRTDSPAQPSSHNPAAGLRTALQERPQGYVPVFFLLFFLSGMCALVYEVTWTRRLILIFGNTVYSVSTVLVAFMGGLAFGSFLFGRLIDKRKDPLRVYAALEAFIGISAVLIPFALSLLNPIYDFLYDRIGHSPYIMSLARFALSTIILVVPTTFMGATLPVLSKFIVRRMDKTGWGIGSLYAVNTLGAMTGCFLAGFVLIGWIGISRSEHLAAAINVLVGLAALALHHRFGYLFADSEVSVGIAEQTEPQERRSGVLWVVLLIFGVSGMLALAYEVLWARMLVFLLGSSIYSFTMILVVYLLGLTAGSLFSARIIDRNKRPFYVFGSLEVLIGISVFAGLLLFRRVPFQEYSLHMSRSGYFIRNFLSTFAIVLPPTLLMGATFPAAVRIYARSLGSLGREVGSLYAVNTVGAIVGSFAAGFVLIPLLGSKNSMIVLILMSIVAGMVLIYLSMRHEGTTPVNWAVGALLIPPLLGFDSDNQFMKELSLQGSKMVEGRVIAFDEDATATVAVLGRDQRLKYMLAVNGHVMTVLCTETQLMAHIPLALAEKPENVLNVCFGMGTTFVSARRAGMNVDLVELCPYVIETFQYFHDDPSMLDEPGVGKIIADGRNYLLLSEKMYDLITIDPPPPPWSAGTANLYTKEFYELCKQRLTPDGIICQWLPTVWNALSEDQYKMLLRTFMEIFPHTSVWGSPSKFGTYLIGTPEKLRIDRESFRAYFEAKPIKEDLSLYMADPLDGKQVLSLFLLNEDAAWKYVGGAPVMTDDLPLLEFPLFRNDPTTRLMEPELLYVHRTQP